MFPAMCPAASTAIVVPIGAVAASRSATSVASAKLRPSSIQAATVANTSRTGWYPPAPFKVSQPAQFID